MTEAQIAAVLIGISSVRSGMWRGLNDFDMHSSSRREATMPDLESRLRSCLLEQADQVSPRPEAARQAVVAAERRRHARVAICSGAVVAAASALVIAALSWHPVVEPPNK